MMDAEQHYQAAALAFRAKDAEAGLRHLRAAAFDGHAPAQEQLARLYFSRVKGRPDIGDLEAAAQGGDHVALFVLAMCFLEGRLIDKDEEKAISALRAAANMGNAMATDMLLSGGRG